METALPDLLHDPAADSGDAGRARETEPALDLRMQPVEI
jgi:hypothetical protein